MAGIAVLVSLGVWQVHRLAWKRDLIERVEQRVHAEPVAAPGREQWPNVNRANSEYLRVAVNGRYQNDKETLVQAVTERGGGFWVLTPFVTDAGYTVLINRGFVPLQRDPGTRAQGQIEGETRVTGLLRLTEQGGGYLRANDPTNDRWFSRDVTAIAAKRGLSDIAPYFIDAEVLEPAVPDAPIGGLTVIAFSNNHLQYALTWFGLALMLIAGLGLVLRHEWRLRRPQTT
ncbi:SURF1 family protein [Steroidobacter flavus]|uniref:SURF1-like protein n=1 Tax=Steroidobacter flavus TaxID=1842136 RepID=A0ABV8T363_9GAMM